ncbi:GIY-YIG nuclease family protein [Bradyrhizobium erythrophlei]|nr:GIY-YIG nuclease family protein [Bradyrhizobium erythrophlei]
MTGSFVYVISNGIGGHKIGQSTNPIQRISDLQTGSAQELKFAYIGVTPGTGFNVEGAAHDLLDQRRIHNEWFAVPASIAIGAVIEAAQRLGEPIQQVSPEMVPQIIHLANQPGEAAPARRAPLWLWWFFWLSAAFLAGVIALVVF